MQDGAPGAARKPEVLGRQRGYVVVQDTLDLRLRQLISEIVRDEVRAALDQAALPSEAPYMSTREAAELARVTPDTVRRWIAEGQLHAVGAGREIRIKRAELEALMKRGRVKRSSIEQSPEFLAREALKRIR